MRADKLFLLINEIDDKLIDDAERTDDSPIEIEYAPRRSPIKEIIALAACAAVLVIGVFTVVKLRIGGIDTPSSSGANSESTGSSDISESSDTSETGEAELTVDLEFPDITQIKLPSGSFEDKLRHIMLSAQTVEELESRIAEINDGQISEVSVTKKTDKIEYLKTGEPVTEGAIEQDMFIKVTLEDGVWYRYYVGSLFENSWKSIGEGPYSDFPTSFVLVAYESETFGDFIAAVSKHDYFNRINEIHLYRSKDDYNNNIECVGDDTVLKDGMLIHIIYDDRQRETTFSIYK